MNTCTSPYEIVNASASEEPLVNQSVRPGEVKVVEEVSGKKVPVKVLGDGTMFKTAPKRSKETMEFENVGVTKRHGKELNVDDEEIYDFTREGRRHKQQKKV